MPIQEQKPPSSKRKKILIILLVLILLAGVALVAWQKLSKKPESSQQAVVKQDIPLFKVGLQYGPVGGIYPDIELITHQFMTNSQMFEGLVRYEDKTKIVPALATDWSNPDNNTWILNLKPNVKFHTGRTMTAKDVKASIETLQKTNDVLNDAYASTIVGVEAVDEDTVKITTDGPDPILLNKLTFLYIFDSQAKPAKNSTAGTGPYMVKPDSKVTENNVEMVAFDDYHGGHAYIRELHFSVQEKTDQLISGFKAGQYNMIGSLRQDSLSELASYETYVTQEPEITFFGINSLAKGPLQKLKVREALAHAINPEALADAINADVNVESQFLPLAIPGHNPDINRLPYDVEKTKQLLREAGEEDLEITVTHSETVKGLDEEIKTQLENAGINAKVVFEKDFDAFIGDVIDGNTQVHYITFVSDVLDGVDMLSQVLQNSANYKNKELDKLIDQANETLDPAERLELTQQAAKIVADDMALIPLYSQKRIWVTDKPYAIKQDMPSSDMDVYLWQVYEK